MIKNALVESLRNSAKETLNMARSIESEATVTLRSNPKEYKLIIPLGMFAGIAIDALGLTKAPNVVYVGECRMGGVDYNTVRIHVREPFIVDPTQWTAVGETTLVWSE